MNAKSLTIKSTSMRLFMFLRLEGSNCALECNKRIALHLLVLFNENRKKLNTVLDKKASVHIQLD